jgi:hypothetical protein
VRPVLATELKSQFAKALGENLPHFKPVAGKSGLFCWKIGPKLCGYVSLVLALNQVKIASDSTVSPREYPYFQGVS